MTEASVRPATDDDLVAAMRVLDGALLEVEAATVRNRTAAGDAFVAEDDGRVIGALVRRDTHILAVAVRRDRRGRGVGRALVQAAAAEGDALTADFDERVRPFYESLGFDIEERGDRLRGRLPK